MDFKKLAPVLFALGLSVSAKAAAIIPLKLPTTSISIIPMIMPGSAIFPMTLPTVDAGIAVPMIMPSPSIGPLELPSPVRNPQPAIFAVEAQVPGRTRVLPVAHAVAVYELREITAVRVTTRVVAVAEEIFDGRREGVRAYALPVDRFF